LGTGLSDAVIAEKSSSRFLINARQYNTSASVKKASFAGGLFGRRAGEIVVREVAGSEPFF
jgi:hypothetical protein